MGNQEVNNQSYGFRTNACKDLCQLIESFCESLLVERNYSRHTIRNYNNDLMSFNIWCDRNSIDPLKAKYRDLRFYLGEMDSAQYARTTINRRLSSLRSFYRWCDIVGVDSSNFADVMSGPKLLKTLPHVVRHSDIDALLKVCCDDIEHSSNETELAVALRDYSIFELLYATGARISEVSQLILENINFEQSQVKFFGKGSKERIVPIYSVAAEALADYIKRGRPVLGRKNNVKTNFCYLGVQGGVMKPDNMRKMFYKKCERAGVTASISPHSMRHTFASDVLDGGADLRSVQEMLGHASLSTTQIYTHLSAKKLKDTHHTSHPRA